MEAAGSAPKTLMKCRQVWEAFIASAHTRGFKTLQAVDVTTFHGYRNDRQASQPELTPYTAHNQDIFVKTFINKCVNLGLLDTNPLARIKLKEPRRCRHPAPTLEQVNLILGDAPADLRRVLAVEAFAGLRVEEVQQLAPADVDLKQREIRVMAGKTDAATRVVPIHPRLHTILSGFDGFKGRYLFNAPPSNRFPDGDHHINPRTINENFEHLAQAHGMPVGRDDAGLTRHALRRFFKTTCFNAGVPKPLVDLWFGHANKNDINNHYYRPQKSQAWMARVGFSDCPS